MELGVKVGAPRWAPAGQGSALTRKYYRKMSVKCFQLLKILANEGIKGVLLEVIKSQMPDKPKIINRTNALAYCSRRHRKNIDFGLDVVRLFTSVICECS